MRISSTNAIEGGRVLYTIGRIEAASAWHPAHGSPLQENWRELVVRELMRKAEDIDADAIIRVDYQNDGVIRIDETGVNHQARGCHRHCGEAFLRRLMPGCRHHARVSPSLTVSAARKEKCPRRSAERHIWRIRDWASRSLDPRVRNLGSSSKKAGPAGQSPRGSGERNHRGKPGLHRCE